MNGLERRISKIEEAAGISDKLSFGSFIEEFLILNSGRSRGLPSQAKAVDPEFDQACDALFAKYQGQASDEGRRRFEEDLVNAISSLSDDGEAKKDRRAS